MYWTLGLSLCLFAFHVNIFASDDFERKFIVINELEEPQKKHMTACFHDQNITVGDSNIDRIDVTFRGFSEKMLCAMKCYQERVGYLSENGNVIMSMVKNDEWFEKANKDEQNTITSCLLDNVTTIRTCNDMRAIGDCVYLIFS